MSGSFSPGLRSPRSLKCNSMVDNRAALKSLPVPELSATLRSLHTVVSAVVDAPTLATTDRTIRDFAASPGPQLQEALLRFAAEKDSADSSWLADRWLQDYLTVRAPLPLATNVGFQINLATNSTGLDRAVELIGILARLHLLQAAGRMPEERDARDQPIDAAQWRCFNGALRHPAPDCDTVTFCELDETSRSIGVLANGHMFNVQITDAAGQLASDDALRSALESVLSQAAGEPAHTTERSYVGSGGLASDIERLRDSDAYHTLQNQLFAVNLLELDVTEAEALRRVAFDVGHAWVYRPITYQINIATGGQIDDFAAMHVEHSTVDGATLVTAMARAQQIRDGELEAELAGEVAGGAWAGPLPVEEMTWEDQDTDAEPGVSEIPQRDLRVDLVQVPRVPNAELPMKFSADAMSQLILSIAQELTYGRIRAVYEAVDMREYKAGRTECLRAVTPEAVAFAQALVRGGRGNGSDDGGDETAGESLAELLRAALDAHRNWVIGCKTGNGIDRHLWALAFTAEKEGLGSLDLMADPGVVAARTDFLSTTSIGSDRQIVRYVFAPTVPNGFGVNYTPGAEKIEYCLTWDAATAEKPEEFQRNLARAGEMLESFLRGM